MWPAEADEISLVCRQVVSKPQSGRANVEPRFAGVLARREPRPRPRGFETAAKRIGLCPQRTLASAVYVWIQRLEMLRGDLRALKSADSLIGRIFPA